MGSATPLSLLCPLPLRSSIGVTLHTLGFLHTSIFHNLTHLAGVDDPAEERLAGVAAHPAVVEVRNGQVATDWAVDRWPLLVPGDVCCAFRSIFACHSCISRRFRGGGLGRGRRFRGRLGKRRFLGLALVVALVALWGLARRWVCWKGKLWLRMR